MMVTLQVLGAAVTVPADLHRRLSRLPTTDRPADAEVRADNPAHALAELTRLAVAHSPLLCVHAGVVSGPDGLIAIPGESGLGKTTLVAALLRAGFGYVSDEALALDRDSGAVTPFPRPLSLRGDVWPLLGIAPAPPPDEERLVPPAALERAAATDGRVRHVVLARRVPGPPRLAPAARGEAVQALLRRAFNHYRAPEASFRAVVAVVREADVWTATYADAPELAELLGQRLRHSAAATAAR
ncbi:MAG TPA: hypothetical protein VH373_21430 [Jatrophihabitantaceae bacterium]